MKIQLNINGLNIKFMNNWQSGFITDNGSGYDDGSGNGDNRSIGNQK